MFTVEPSETEPLDGLQLVELLRVLLHAERSDRRTGAAKPISQITPRHSGYLQV